MLLSPSLLNTTRAEYWNSLLKCVAHYKRNILRHNLHTPKHCYTASCLRSTLSCLNLSLVTQYAGPLWPLRVRLVHLWPTRTSGDECSSHSKPHLTTCAALLLVWPDVWQLSTWILSVCQLSSTTAWFHSTRTLGCTQSASVRRYGASSVSP